MLSEQTASAPTGRGEKSPQSKNVFSYPLQRNMQLFAVSVQLFIAPRCRSSTPNRYLAIQTLTLSWSSTLRITGTWLYNSTYLVSLTAEEAQQ